MRRVTWSRFPI